MSRSGAPRPRLVRLGAALGVLAAVLLGQASDRLLKRYRFALNQTESLPNWAFITDQAQRHPARGDLVVFVAPPNPYVPAGAVFGKIVAGVPGDVVERRGRTFFINGHRLGVAKPRSRDGRPAAPGPVGRIPAGHYFVFAPHPDSLDSRYAAMGWIAQPRVLGRAWPVL